MEVILTKDVRNLGYANDVVIVKAGYAQNYLIPQGLAVLANKSSLKMQSEIAKQKSFKLEKLRNQAAETVKKLENVVLKIGAKAASSGKIYGSVNAIQIAEALQQQYQFEVDRKKIHLDGDSVKELGTYKASIELHKDLKVTIQFEVVAE
ncbi:MAG TPA: 50S ribosomal protein L9 [Bacteroidales bacterium]|nr:50S ribosomal protein L9 [Bacteroidales bacterium]